MSKKKLVVVSPCYENSMNKRDAANARKFLLALQSEFKYTEPKKYNNFLVIMDSLVKKKITKKEMLSQVKRLLKKHTYLLHWFYTFMPQADDFPSSVWN